MKKIMIDVPKKDGRELSRRILKMVVEELKEADSNVKVSAALKPGKGCQTLGVERR